MTHIELDAEESAALGMAILSRKTELAQMPWDPIVGKQKRALDRVAQKLLTGAEEQLEQIEREEQRGHH